MDTNSGYKSKLSRLRGDLIHPYGFPSFLLIEIIRNSSETFYNLYNYISNNANKCLASSSFPCPQAQSNIKLKISF